MAAEAPSSPWHRGELEAQRRAGVDPAFIASVEAFQRDHLTEQHRDFYPKLPFLVVGAVDDEGRPWATLLEGQPGFLQAPDERHLRVQARADAGDPAAVGLGPGRSLGLLGIELATRRRNRLNGRVVESSADGLTVEVDRAFGNCPKYIHTRTLRFVPGQAGGARDVERRAALDAEARETIRASGTFFVASYAPAPSRAVDVSHRGGRPGFVDVDGDWLTIPDFVGNRFFNTLGNFLVNPQAGLLFPDFTTGDVLQLSGAVEVAFEGPRVGAFEGALRLWRFRVERLVRRRAALHWRGALHEQAAEVAPTGSWIEARRRLARDGPRGWRRLRVEAVVDEAEDVRSFVLRPVDAAEFASGDAGMHLVLRLPAEDAAATGPLVRSYSLSRLPADGAYRISVKRAGSGSREIWRRLREGEVIEARGPQGEFVVDPRSARPVVLLSTGIGITPMRAMAEQILAEGGRRVHFIHGGRHGGAMSFGAELAALQARSRGRLALVRVFSRPREADRLGASHEFEGHLDVDVLRRVLPFDDHDFYLCGPAAFMQQLYDGLRALRVDDDRIHAEAFGPSALRRTSASVPAPPALVQAQPALVATPVRFARSARAATWLPGSGSLLELAERCGLAPEFGCRAGTCGTCRTPLLGGEVAYPGRAQPAGAAAGVLICCAVPAQAPAHGDAAELALDL